MDEKIVSALSEPSHMDIVIVGHVDHGKSTVIGRLLADTGSLPEGKLEQVQEMCRRNSRPFEYAFLLDALKDERAQGITIDTARSFFQTKKRKYIIIDAPGHIEFLKNMITGASRAEAALLVIDAAEGVRENSRRHGYMLSMLGIKKVCVLVNKMDLVGYDRAVFDRTVAEYDEFLGQIGITPSGYIPVSAMQGDNIASHADSMSWYDGPAVIDALDNFTPALPMLSMPFRMPVQDVYKFTAAGDDRRIIAGTVETGVLAAGDEVVFYPSGKRTRVKNIEPMRADEQQGIAQAGYAAGFTMEEQIYIRRGELCVKADEPAPLVGRQMKVSLFWLGRQPMVRGKSYFLKTGAMKMECRLDEISGVIDASTLEKKQKDCIERHDVADCIISTSRLIAFDNAAEIAATGRFVIVDDYEISGGGIFTDTASGTYRDEHKKLKMRSDKWEKGSVSASDRVARYGQRPALIIITGPANSDKKSMAKLVEKELFEAGRFAYYLGIGSVLYGVNADLNPPEDKDYRPKENIRRLAETANILLDTGLALVITASDLTQYDLELIKLVTKAERVLTVWLGDRLTTDLKCDLVLENDRSQLQTIVEQAEELVTDWDSI